MKNLIESLRLLHLSQSVEQMIPSVEFMDGSEKKLQAAQGIRQALEVTDELLSGTAREMLNHWGLSDKHLKTEARNVTIAPFPSRIEECSPGVYNPRTGEAKFIADHFCHMVDRVRRDHIGGVSPIGSALYSLAAIYAEEAVVHPLSAWRKDTPQLTHDVFHRALVRLYPDRWGEIDFFYEPYPIHETEKRLPELKVVINGLRPWFSWNGKYLGIRGPTHVDEMMTKTLTLDYILRLGARLGVEIPEETLVPIYLRALELDQPDDHLGFASMRSFLAGKENQVVPLIARGIILDEVVSVLAEKSREEAINFAQSVIVGDIPTVVDVLSQLWPDLPSIRKGL